MSIEEQNNHTLYKDAHARFVRAEEQQNIKAAAKYPEPLNPASWTAEGLADHAAQEAVDMLRYIEALKAKCEGVERENNLLENSIRSVIIELQGIESGGCDDVQKFARECWLRLSRDIWTACLKREEGK